MLGVFIYGRIYQIILIVAYVGMVRAAIFESIEQPTLNFDDFGDRIGLFGSYDGISLYAYQNASAFLEIGESQEDGHQNMYIRNPVNNNNLQLASFDGGVTQMMQLSDETLIINGNFTMFNNNSIQSPIIYNITSQEAASIFPTSSNDGTPTIKNGDVKTIFIDGGLVYMGGDFEFNNTHGVALYNLTSKELKTTLFKGFGKNSSVNAIAKIFDEKNDDESHGSIIFGGEFTDLGLGDLLKHNVTKNATNSSLITAEQQVSLKYGTFTNDNGDGDESSLICPSSNVGWSLIANQGGQWAVELPDEMKGISPTKARLYVPEGADGVKTFRIYSYPNNGIMNLSYIDPSTNELTYCDAWCPLLTVSDLKNATEENKEYAEEFSDDDTYVDSDDGSFTNYYDPSTKTKTLGYSANFQEFSFENSISIDKVAVTILDWYGSKGKLSGFELYSNSITAYGNDTLNSPNCDSDDSDTENNFSEINEGTWNSVKSVSNQPLSDTDYLVSVLDSDSNSKPSITLYPNISYSGNYSIIMTTPGCVNDDSCDLRSIVNVSVIDNDDKILSSQLIYQNNDYDKFDYLYYGKLDGSTTKDGSNKIEITYHDSIIPDTNQSWVVVDKVSADIVSLDDQYSQNMTHNNSNKHKYELAYIKLNGLFEYSLANFSNFREELVSYKQGNKTIINTKNDFVGNSSINLLSSKLSDSSIINQMTLYNSSESSNLLVLGEFESKNLSLTNNNFISLSINRYNTTSNESETSSSDYKLRKRDTSSTINGATFNDSISKIFNFNDDLIFLGRYSMDNNDNSSVELTNISNGNESTSSINNFAVYSDNEWYGFGNDFIDVNFDQFTNLTVNDIEMFILSSSSSGDTKVWDNSNFKWIENNEYLLNISHAMNLNSKQQILIGTSFSIMEYYNNDQSLLKNNNNFSSYNFNINEKNYRIDNSLYINDSLIVVGGNFKTSSDVVNIGFIDNTGKNKTISPLNGKINWDENTTIDSLYTDSNYLFIGTNGSVEINESTNLTGIIIYDMKHNAFTKFQPAELSNNGNSISINSIVLYDKSNKLLVGGNFSQAGSLDCTALCLYDLDNTRWTNPFGDSDDTLDGVVTNIKFHKSDEVLISGNLTYNGDKSNFITYKFGESSANSISKLNKLGSKHFVENFIISGMDNKDLDGGMVAYGSDFIYGYDGSKWTRIDKEIKYSSDTKFTALTLLDLEKANSKNKEAYFDKNKVLIVSGAFELSDYGLVNAALYDGTNWTPYIYSSRNNKLGEITTILIKDDIRFQSSDDLSSPKNLSEGKVVGISLACALGSTTLIGLLYIIPFLALSRKNKEHDNSQRIQENDMMNAVNPTDLLHEIDLQRN
ncbi:DEHA2E16874p [Debaryomyces hansenii CBS767]|uniref:DEHA2E16874p n=1 Tax=Debaryomyces hansenii (strain ATCC 36239 / CBS 767 / BCRC 21394 / JCM 1990 / NBRC 0083 / IGC 2968) TaxID=284592 RepID=B5RU29_DEBHA|nr:DEHA2E16874p [Debaryomyces hansenii CBS767]CAR65841.1 DEHA2E16874p [Debaryomyces hansenii CBS767]|eukprot:XP_002770498.1 DEHA2E16874p [Debaryomyces hansenii CBS767]